MKLEDRLCEISKIYRKHVNDEDLISMIAELREFVNHEELEDYYKHDVISAMVAGPEHVIFYAAAYISLLENKMEELK